MPAEYLAQSRSSRNAALTTPPRMENRFIVFDPSVPTEAVPDATPTVTLSRDATSVAAVRAARARRQAATMWEPQGMTALKVTRRWSPMKGSGMPLNSATFSSNGTGGVFEGEEGGKKGGMEDLMGVLLKGQGPY